MPANKKQLRRKLIRQRFTINESVSPDEPQLGLLTLQHQHEQLQLQQPPQQLPLSTQVVTANQSWNNTEPDDEEPDGSGGKCTPEQRDRLTKCQKSLEQLEFSLNNLLLKMSQASTERKQKRRLEEADRFLTDLVDCVRANRSNRRRRAKRQPPKSTTQQPAASAAMRRRLEEESRALWLAQHIGARCEDTVDRYMLDVVVDRIGEMADKDDCGGAVCGRAGPGRKKRPGPKTPQGCDSSEGGGSEGANRHNSCCERRDICFTKQIDLSDTRRPRRVGGAQRQRASKQTQHPTPPSQQQQQQQQQQELSQEQQDKWTLSTWQPHGSNNNNSNCDGGTAEVPSVTIYPSTSGATTPPSRRGVTDMVANVAAYRRGSRRYEKALRVAAYLRDMCREFYRNSCAGRAPPAAQALEAAFGSLVQLVAMRDRAVALAIRCTACPAMCAAERVSNPQLCRLRGLLRLACTRGDCADATGGILDLTEALAAADRSDDRCRLLRRLRLIGTQGGGADADYRRLFNALASFTEIGNCAANYAAHRKRMCGTAPPLTSGPRGVTAADLRALALDLAAEEANEATDASAAARRRCCCGDAVATKQPARPRCRRRPAGASASAAAARPLADALHSPKKFRQRLRMHQFATGASLAVKANEGFREP